MRWSVLFIAAGLLLHLPSAGAMEPLTLQPSPSADQALSQEQSSLDASSRALKVSAGGDPSLRLLDEGPRHPGGSPLLNVGF